MTDYSERAWNWLVTLEDTDALELPVGIGALADSLAAEFAAVAAEAREAVLKDVRAVMEQLSARADRVDKRVGRDEHAIGERNAYDYATGCLDKLILIRSTE